MEEKLGEYPSKRLKQNQETEGKPRITFVNTTTSTKSPDQAKQAPNQKTQLQIKPKLPLAKQRGPAQNATPDQKQEKKTEERLQGQTSVTSHQALPQPPQGNPKLNNIPRFPIPRSKSMPNVIAERYGKL